MKIKTKRNIFIGILFVCCIFFLIEIIASIFNSNDDDFSFPESSQTYEEVEEDNEKDKIEEEPKVYKDEYYEPVRIIVYRHGSIGVDQYGQVVYVY